MNAGSSRKLRVKVSCWWDLWEDHSFSMLSTTVFDFKHTSITFGLGMDTLQWNL